MKIKSVLKEISKYFYAYFTTKNVKEAINPLLLIIGAVSIFAYYFCDDGRVSWYVRDIGKNIAIIFFTGFIYRTRIYRHGLLNILHKCFFAFIFIRSSFNIADEILAFLHNIHIHKIMLVLQSIPLSIICLIAVYNLIKGEKCNKVE